MLLPLQALIASQTGESSSNSNDAKAQAAATSLPSTTSEAPEVEDSPAVGEDREQSQDASFEILGGGAGRTGDAEPPDSIGQGKNFTAWLGGQTSTASPLLVDEVQNSVLRASAVLVDASGVVSLYK